jgi:hypothetical protein
MKTRFLPALAVVMVSVLSGPLQAQAPDTWTNKALIPVEPRRSTHIAFAIGDFGYMGAGGNSDQAYMKDLWRYDPVANSWLKMADYPGLGRNLMVSAVVNGKAYVGLGTGAAINGAAQPKQDFWEYDPSTNHWTQKASFPGDVTMYDGSAFTLNSKVYMVGGYTTSATNKKDVWEFDPSLNQWTQKADFPGTARSAAGAFSMGDKGYICGGFLDSGGGSNEFWEFDGVTWTKKQNLLGSYLRPVAAGVNGAAYVGAGSTTRFIKYDFATSTWTDVAPYAPIQFGAEAFVIRNNIYVVGHNPSAPPANRMYTTDCVGPTLDIEAPTKICYGESAELIVSGGVTYNWGDNATFSEINGTRIVTPTEQTTYTVTGTNELGCVSTKSVTVNVIRPTSTFQAPQLVCTPDAANLSFTGLVPLNMQFHWKLDSPHDVITNSDSTALQVMWTTTGTKNIELVTELEGCFDTTAVAISHRPRPDPDFLISVSSLCQFDTAKISYTGVMSDGFTWDFNGATIVSHKADSVYMLKWTTNGDKSISLNVSRDGCSSSAARGVSVTKTPSSQFTPSLVCQDRAAEVSYAGNGTPAATYLWDFDGANVSSGIGQGPYQLSWSTLGQKNVSLTVTEEGCSSSTSIIVAVNPNPDFTFESDEDICYSGTYHIAYTGQNDETVTWDFDGASVLGGTGKGPYELDWDLAGEKNISALVTRNGCMRDTVFSIVVGPEVLVPELCFVSITDEGDHNKLSWSYEHPENISKFGIYRESNVANQFELIEYVDPAGVQTYIDEGSLPAQRSYRYAISAVDTCDVETAFGSSHQTMHLQVSDGSENTFALNWEQYDGLSFGTYTIKRKMDNSDFDLLTQVSSNLHSFTDNPDNVHQAAYQIEISVAATCPGIFNGEPTPVGLIQSNTVAVVVMGLEPRPTPRVLASPNPFTNRVTVSGEGTAGRPFKVVSSNGAVVREGILDGSGASMDMSSLASGLYLLQVEMPGRTESKKVIKE